MKIKKRTSGVVTTLGVVGVGESDAAGSLDEDHVGHGVPGVLVQGQSQVRVVGAEGALLGESTEKTGAAGATVGPESHGVSGGVALGLHQPVVEVLGAVHLDVTGELVKFTVRASAPGRLVTWSAKASGV